MVKEIVIQNKSYYICEECSLNYSEKSWAEKCQAWCSEQHSCNLEITKHAINTKESEE